MTAESSSQKVFNTFELLKMICEFSDSVENFRIACTCRLAFDAAVPQIWKKLDDLQPLLALLAPQVVTYETSFKVVIPKTAEFTRFEKYSPFVRQLTTSNLWQINAHQGKRKFTLESWSTLISRAKIGPLLANLRALNVKGSPDSDDEVILYLSTFIVPSLRSLHIHPEDHKISLSTTFSILALVRKSCPQLGTLSTGLSACNVQQAASLYPIFSSLIADELKTMHSLSFLHIHFNLMNSNTLSALAKLSQLERLFISNMLDPHDYTIAGIEAVFLPEDSFPALRSLILGAIDVTDILSIWSIPPLVKRLTHLHLNDTFSDAGMYSVFGEVARFLPPICIGSPHLQDIIIHSYDPMHGPASVDNFDSSWSHMTQLPLRRVELLNFQCDAQFLDRISRVWQNVTELHLPGKSASYEDLVNLACLPKLEILVIDSFCHFNDPTPHTSRSTHQVDAPLHTIELQTGIAQELKSSTVENIARFLVSIWPNLQRVNCDKEGSTALSCFTIDLLNVHIRMIQGVAETKQRISALYGSSVVPSLLSQRFSRV
ncbi:hypothetical protein BDV93DRAFT_606047 [Ceratobasidium sp. AG-I]|nr:hypothetical protein BDV93DRAFT_606047 [Ceratobasidium sp. AG-I]